MCSVSASRGAERKEEGGSSAQAGTSWARPALYWTVEMVDRLILNLPFMLPGRWNKSKKLLGSHSEAVWF